MFVGAHNNTSCNTASCCEHKYTLTRTHTRAVIYEWSQVTTAAAARENDLSPLIDSYVVFIDLYLYTYIHT